MHAEIVTTGTELLLGEIVDTNAAYIARQLRSIGLNLYYKTTVGDNEERMTLVLQQALQRSDVIIVTGGLGPTVDDVTRPAVARATGRELVLDPELLESIQAHYARWGRTMSENNRRQAYKPQGAMGIKNPVGTAPIFVVEEGDKLVITLPGVPREMMYLLDNVVLPYLREKLHLTEVILIRNVHTCAIGESNVDRLVDDLEQEANPTVGLAAHPGQTDVRITAKATSEAEARAMLDEMETRIRQRLGDVIYGVDEETLEGRVMALLRAQGLTLALVETNTMGNIAQRLSAASEGYAGLKGSLIASTEDALVQGIGVPAELLAETGPFSHERTLAVASAARKTYGADLGMAVLGSSGRGEGPYGGGSTSGRSCIGLVSDGGSWTRDYDMSGRDAVAQVWISTRALDTLRRQLSGFPLVPPQAQ